MQPVKELNLIDRIYFPQQPPRLRMSTTYRRFCEPNTKQQNRSEQQERAVKRPENDAYDRCYSVFYYERVNHCACNLSGFQVTSKILRNQRKK